MGSSAGGRACWRQWLRQNASPKCNTGRRRLFRKERDPASWWTREATEPRKSPTHPTDRWPIGPTQRVPKRATGTIDRSEHKDFNAIGNGPERRSDEADSSGGISPHSLHFFDRD
jgi:hypothetical protein